MKYLVVNGVPQNDDIVNENQPLGLVGSATGTTSCPMLGLGGQPVDPCGGASSVVMCAVMPPLYVC